jgi:hypothetical protein
MTLRSKENYINAAANYAWDELPHASTGGEACLTTAFGILLVSQISILNSIQNNDAGKLSRLMVATRKYKETMTCRLAEGRPDSVLYAENSG